MDLRLTVEFEDSTGSRRKLSGVYNYLSCLERIRQMEEIPGFVGYTLDDA